MIKPGGNFFKNLKVCLKTSQANIPNRAYVKYCCVVKNLTFLRNMCITSLSSMLCRPSYVKPKDCSIMNKIDPIDKIMLPPQSEFPKIPNLFLLFLPFTLTSMLFLSSETPYCASVHRTLLYRAMFDCLNSPSISWRGCWLGPLYDCVCLFVSYICICLLYLFFVFVSVSVFVRPLSSSLSSFMLIIIIYLCNRNLSSPSSAPYTRILLLQNFSTNCQRL